MQICSQRFAISILSVSVGFADNDIRITDLCPCGETQTMSHIVESCPLTKLNGGLYRLHSADEDGVSWLTNYGS